MVTAGRPSNQNGPTTGPFTLDDLGFTKNQSSRYQAEARVPEDEFVTWVARTREDRKQLTSTALERMGRVQPTVVDITPQPTCEGVCDDLNTLIEAGETFGCIYADPPWKYGNQGTRAATGNHYATMTVDEICEEPVSRLSSPNAHLHLWTTNAFLPEAFRVIQAWGFTYKSCLLWVKPQMGIGNYWRVSHEFLLLGIKGKAPFRNRAQMSWLQAARTKHSRKPPEVRERIEMVSPGPYLEMYGREKVDGWTVYGNQVDAKPV